MENKHEPNQKVEKLYLVIATVIQKMMPNLMMLKLEVANQYRENVSFINLVRKAALNNAL